MLLGNFLFVLATDDLEHSNVPVPKPRKEKMKIAPSTPINTKKNSCPVNNSHLFSTPTTRGQFEDFQPSDSEGSEDSFEHFARQARHNRIEDTGVSSDLEISLGETGDDSESWCDKDEAVLKYVDDFIAVEKIRISDGISTFTQNKTNTNVPAIRCENFFKTVKRNAGMIGMSVNDKKTQLLCISSAIHSNVTASIKLPCGESVTSQTELKQLGFFFGSRPTVDVLPTPGPPTSKIPQATVDLETSKEGGTPL